MRTLPPIPLLAVPVSEANHAGPALALRCDGSAQVGAGHVGRCLPLAQAFAERGWKTTFVGRYDGLASWLLGRANERAELPDPEAPCGLQPERWDAAIVDSYGLQATELCDLAERIPIATLGEAMRCDRAGIVIDYHLDRIGEQPEKRLLPGPAYAPLDPAFAGAGRAGDDVNAVLVTVGGSEQALKYVPALVAAVKQTFPAADTIVPVPGHGSAAAEPTRLVELVGSADLAVSAAGLTAYELACAGLPQVSVAMFANQRRVAAGIRRSGLAPSVDLVAGEGLASIFAAVARLSDRRVRRKLSERGRVIFDGRSACRAAEGLLARWGNSCETSR